MNHTMRFSVSPPPASVGAPTDSPSDEDLILRCGDDDSAAFAELVHRYEGKLFGYLRRYLGDSEAAEDVCQATFLQVHLCRDSFERGRRFRPWLYAIATNQAIDARRRNRRHRMASLDATFGPGAADGTLLNTLADDEPPAEERAAERDAAVGLNTAIARLPQPMQAVLALVYGENLKYREVAVRLRIPVGTVKSRVHAAIHRLHQHLDN